MRKKILALVTTIVMIFASVGFIVGCGDDKAFTAPTITLAYDSVVIGKGATYDLLDGVTVSDEYDSEIAASVSDNGGFNKDVAGKYTVTYSATNSKGKEATATRTVEVAEGVLPAMGSYLKKGSAIAVPTFSESVRDAALTVSYKADGATDWTELSKTDGAYLLNFAAGNYSVKYEAKKDKFEYSATVSVKVYEVTAPGNSVTIVGQNVTLGTPTVSDNVDGEIAVYAKTGDADYAEVELDEASGSYKINDIAEGVTDVKYVVTVTEGVTEEVFCTVTAVNAKLSDTSTDSVAAGEVTLRTPTVSTGVNVNVTAELRDSTRAAMTITDNKITVASGDIVKVTYAYTYGTIDLGSDSYYIYSARTGANVIDFESGSWTNYVTDPGQNMISEDIALSGSKSYRCVWTSTAMGNWLGFKGASISFESAVNTIDVYLYLGEHVNGGGKDEFVNDVELAIEADGKWLYPIDSDTSVHWQTIKKGWAKYSFTYDKSFSTLSAAVLHLNTTNANDAGYQVYMDDLVCYNK